MSRETANEWVGFFDIFNNMPHKSMNVENDSGSSRKKHHCTNRTVLGCPTTLSCAIGIMYDAKPIGDHT